MPPLAIARRFPTVLALVAGMSTAWSAAPQPTAKGSEFFEKRVRPILVESCHRCHSASAEKLKGGLLLDTREASLRGGGSGPALVPGHPEQSRLVEAITWENPDLQMPPRRKLSDAQIADLTEWVRQGAPWPAEDAPQATLVGKATDANRAREHWAFQPLSIQPPPATTTHPVDAFIEVRLAARGLKAAAPASRRTLVRRLYYDLTGLPPTPEEVDAFVADPSEQAWEHLIDRLLESPHYGEKWGRHWLDLVRFAETNSYESDGAKPNAWRYRDYVIQSFNADKPYDRFIREQLAGDELPDATDETRIATGYYRLGIWDADPADRELAKYDQLDDLVATTGHVFLGLTVDCARCHDHKIDPISQRDYYALLAFFRNINPYQNGGATDEAPLEGASPKDKAARKALVVSEAGTNAPTTFLLRRGSPENPGEAVEPAFPHILNPPAPRVVPPANGRSSGRRLALAEWIASPDNRMTARVLVNRVWQHHFGRGLARTPSDFGLQGQPPTHPELLDWLARDFVGQGWSLKRLHRRLLTSQAYQRSSVATPEMLKADPANDLLARFDMRRLTAEEIRDSTLWISGAPNQKMFGPGVYITLPKEILAGQSVPGQGWGKAAEDEQLRRSIYIHVKRSLLPPVLAGFDLAETDRSTPVRFATTQPTQALGMLNGTFFNEHAVRLADRVRREAGESTPAQVRRALALVTSRPPSDAEVTRGVGLIRAMQQDDGATSTVALASFCLLALNLNEFLYLD
jgi:cytochrome c553